MFSYVYPFCNVQARLNTSISSYYHFLVSFLVLIIALGLWTILTYRKVGEWNLTISTTLPWDPKLSHNKLKHNTISTVILNGATPFILILTLRHCQEKKEQKSQKHGSMLMFKWQRIFREWPRFRSYTGAHFAHSGNYETMNLEDHPEGRESVEGILFVMLWIWNTCKGPMG